MTASHIIIMLAVILPLLIALIIYCWRYKPTKEDRRISREKTDDFFILFWIAKEIIMFVANKLRRKKR